MDTLRSLQYFVRAVELGSLSASAREHATTQPTVSKALAALEKDLGVRLMERSTTSLVLTVQGRHFYDGAKRVLEEYGDAVAQARGLTERPSGLLRVNAPVALGQFRINELVQCFLEKYPDIEIELILNDRFVDLVEEGVDVAIRLGSDLPPNAIARKVGVSQRFLVASPSYLAAHARLRNPADLQQHEYIRFAWQATADMIELHSASERVTVKTRGRYRVNNALAIRESLAMGSGIGLCPAWFVHDLLASKQLVRVLPKWSGVPQELFLLYPSRRYQPLRTRLFMDFMEEHLLRMPGIERDARR